MRPRDRLVPRTTRVISHAVPARLYRYRQSLDEQIPTAPRSTEEFDDGDVGSSAPPHVE